jgi:hypothetical protein
VGGDRGVAREEVKGRPFTSPAPASPPARSSAACRSRPSGSPA